MAQAQSVAKLMDSHSEQVSPLAIWGRRELGLDLCPSPTPGREAAWKPLEWGLLAEGSNQEILQRWLSPDPSVSHFVLLVCVRLFGRFFFFF